ncbi:MAG: HAD family phosphatase [Acidobacteriota bacterium]|nr:HAD family phosphatase [Acidobacteriota bacterium]
MGTLKAVAFDYGKVLSLPPTEAQWERFSQRFAKPVQEFQKIYWHHREELDRGTLDNPEYWKAVGKDCGFQVTDEEADRLIDLDNDQWTNVCDETLSLARDLHAHGYRTAILSNMERRMLRFMRGKLTWLDEFDVQIYSCEIGMVKPESAIYQYLCRRLGCDPGEVLFLDDKLVNVEGARKFGLESYVFHSAPDAVMLTGRQEISVAKLRRRLLPA